MVSIDGGSGAKPCVVPRETAVRIRRSFRLFEDMSSGKPGAEGSNTKVGGRQRVATVCGALDEKGTHFCFGCGGLWVDGEVVVAGVEITRDCEVTSADYSATVHSCRKLRLSSICICRTKSTQSLVVQYPRWGMLHTRHSGRGRGGHESSNALAVLLSRFAALCGGRRVSRSHARDCEVTSATPLQQFTQRAENFD